VKNKRCITEIGNSAKLVVGEEKGTNKTREGKKNSYPRRPR